MRNTHLTIFCAQDTHVHTMATPPSLVFRRLRPALRRRPDDPLRPSHSVQRRLFLPVRRLLAHGLLASGKEPAFIIRELDVRCFASRTVSFSSQAPGTEEEQARPSRQLQVKSDSRERDLSDVVRRVGANSSTRSGLDFYIDPTEDHESGDMIMVKKKKSRVALDILFDESASMATSQTPFGRPYQRTCPLMD
jgi:hypothetical protein